MKRKLLLLFIVVSFSAKGQTSGCYQIDTIPFAPDSFNVGVPLILYGDKYSPIIPIGFNFCLFDSVYSQLLISSNDYLCFAVQYANGFSPWAIPTSVDLLYDAVLGPWQDLFLGYDTVYYTTSGIAPFRKFVVSYYDIPLYCFATAHVTNQIILYETTNIIEIHTLSRPSCISWDSHVFGLGNRAGADDLFWVNFPITNKSFRFTPLCASCATGVNEIENLNSSISLFPNPATSEIKIKNAKSKIESVEVFDVMGQLQTSNLRPQTNSVDVSSLAQGIYFVKVTGENTTAVAKFVKQ
jgi:hypothetical protein